MPKSKRIGNPAPQRENKLERWKLIAGVTGTVITFIKIITDLFLKK